MAVLKPPFYIVSDTHWGDPDIANHQLRPDNHELLMVKRWQRAIKPGDRILHLGDLCHQDGYDEFREKVVPELPGRKYIVLGNHDEREWDYRGMGFTVLKPFTVMYRDYKVSFAHRPKELDPERDTKRIHIHGHIHSLEPKWGNINVSVERLDYRPHRVTRLLNHEIQRRKDQSRYTNSRHYRCHQTRQQRRAA
jgi:calcineurin-like phosphoesterase family protein